MIPLLKVLYELIGVTEKEDQRRRLRRSENLPQIITGVTKVSTKIIKIFKRIQNLTDDLFCTGEIPIIDCCLEVYRQYIENEDFDPFLYSALEINLTLRNLKLELEDFYKNLEKHFIRLYKFLKYNGVFVNDPCKLEKDLKKQFAKLIILDSKYSSGHFTKIKNIFLKEFNNKKNFYHKFFF